MLRSIRQRVTVVSNVLLLGAVLVAWYYVLVAGKVLSCSTFPSLYFLPCDDVFAYMQYLNVLPYIHQPEYSFSGYFMICSRRYQNYIVLETE